MAVVGVNDFVGRSLIVNQVPTPSISSRRAFQKQSKEREKNNETNHNERKVRPHQSLIIITGQEEEGSFPTYDAKNKHARTN